MSYAVLRRTREIGIRLAIGARPPSVMWMVLRDSVVLVLIGAALGIPAALGAGRYLRNQLFGVTPADPARDSRGHRADARGHRGGRIHARQAREPHRSGQGPSL